MIVYILKDQDGFQILDFVYEVPADPLDEGNFLLPACPYTNEPPPETGEHEIAVFNGSWVTVPNLKGTVYWLNGQPAEITLLGQELPEGATLAPPVEQVSRITAAQLVQQLILDGKDDDVYPALEAIQDSTLRKILTARYERETVFVLDEPYLIQLATAVGYDTEEKRKEFFNKAATL